METFTLEMNAGAPRLTIKATSFENPQALCV